MSGSSLDGLDIAHCMFQVSMEGKFAVNDWEIIDGTTIPYSEDWQDRLQELPNGSAIDLAKADGQFGQYRAADYDLDGDVNGNDKLIWFPNNGTSSRVPR